MSSRPPTDAREILTTTVVTRMRRTDVLPKQALAARIRADLAEYRIKRKDLARLTERSAKTVERWLSDAAEHDRYRPTRSELVVVAYLTGYPVSRYTDDPADDVLFPLSPAIDTLRERLQAVEAAAGEDQATQAAARAEPRARSRGS
jgi:transcriptional regulator with XRE-family HTH domain